MPTNCSPRPPSSAWARTNSGISSRHGAHQVAQKLTTSTLPRHCASVCSVPVGVRQRDRRAASPHRGRRLRAADAERAAAEVDPGDERDGRGDGRQHQDQRGGWHGRTRMRDESKRSHRREGLRGASLRSIEPALLRRRGLDRNPGLAAGGGHRDRDLLHLRRIADADVGAALRLGADASATVRAPPRRAAAGPRSMPAVGLDAAEELVVLDLARRQRGAAPSAAPSTAESELVAIEVVAVGDDEPRLDRRVVERRGRRSAKARSGSSSLSWAAAGVGAAHPTRMATDARAATAPQRGRSPARARSAHDRTVPRDAGRSGAGARSPRASAGGRFGADPVEVGSESIGKGDSDDFRKFVGMACADRRLHLGVAIARRS